MPAACCCAGACWGAGGGGGVQNVEITQEKDSVTYPTWSAVFQAMHADPSGQAALISQAWAVAAQSGNSALLSNLLCNMNSPAGICQTLDFSGIPFTP
jgi:hypothetical protein